MTAYINNLPASIQGIIQQGWLEHTFEEALRAQLAFRKIAQKERFSGNLGETITKTRRALLAAITSASAPAANTDITSGMVAQQWGVEQYVLRLSSFSGMEQLNFVTQKVGIEDLFLQNTESLAEQAARSIDLAAQAALFNAYFGGNTHVSVTLGSAGTSVQVDDIRGFYAMVPSTGGLPVPVSNTYPLLVTIGSTTYSCVGAVADGTMPTVASNVPAYGAVSPSYSGTGTNTSLAPGGISGTLTLSTNVSTEDATSGNTVLAANASLIIRPDNSTNTLKLGTISGATSTATIQSILKGKATLKANNVPTFSDGLYECYMNPLQAIGLYADPAFQSFSRGNLQSPEWKKGVIAELLGVRIIENNMNPVQYVNGNAVHNAIITGKGALVEAEFTQEGYNSSIPDTGAGTPMVNIVDGIAHVMRPPIDVAQQVVTQSWVYIGGFVAPTDALTTTAQIPSATPSAMKRAVVIQSF